MNTTLRLKIDTLPESPGCYLMKRKDTILYVGKAKNLKNRVRTYFQSTRTQTAKVQALVGKIDDFDIMICDTNLEALILESNLIKLHMPYYNILLKDSKAYPYVRIDLKQEYPRLEVVRRIENDGAKYFGPYLGATSVREVMDTVRKVFPLRTCKGDIKPDPKKRPCLHHQLGHCHAPCTGGISSAEYREIVLQVIQFLSGKYQGILIDLQARMRKASEAMQFEHAATLRDRIKAVEALMERQKAISTTGGDMDVIALAQDGLDAMVQVLFVRGGRMIGGEHFALERAGDEPRGEVLGSFMLQYYQEQTMIPRELWVEEMPEDAEALEAMLGQRRDARVDLRMPQRGQKHDMIEMAQKNAEDALKKRNLKLATVHARTTGAMEALGEALALPVPPRRIEGYDISNTQGNQSVASMVVAIDGVASKKDYRHFRIKTVEGANDFASMAEVISRRLAHAKREMEQRQNDGKPVQGGSFTDLPDLILIDGGPQQLAFAQQAMHEQGFDIPMFGLAKKLEEIYLPGQEESILLPRHSPALHLIQRLRDEAHRFAITHHRALRGKASVHSQLEDIPGVGPARRRALLKHFRTMERLKHATPAELAEVSGVSEQLAQLIHAHFLAQK